MPINRRKVPGGTGPAPQNRPEEQSMQSMVDDAARFGDSRNL
ncbi:hypothetical protein [Mycolicibacillus koreensis]|nr:hypothetical protein [Mycolicibacillus koreensis]